MIQELLGTNRFSAKDFDLLMNEFFSPFIKSEDSSFPPYNIIRNEDNTKFRIEMAVAGISKDDLTINLEKNVLTISHKKVKDDDTKLKYVHRGIAQRNFVQRFLLGEYVQVQSADLQNGILVIELTVVIPEEKKPKIIQIGGSTIRVDKQLLNE